MGIRSFAAELLLPAALQPRPRPAALDGTPRAEAASFAALAERLGYLSKAEIKLIREAYKFADEAHLGQFRASGEPYITHPLAVAKQSVKANWAALVGGGKVHWLGGNTIILEGMKRHVRIQKTLPCGWVDWILLHKQASLKEMNPDQPFYLLDDGTQPIPPLFYPMLNRCLAVPVLPE